LEYFKKILSRTLKHTDSVTAMVTRLGEFSSTYWAIDHFGQFLKIALIAQKYGSTILHGNSCVLILTKKWVGQIFRKLIVSPWSAPGLPDGIYSNQKFKFG
jgi:hypothetical protein